MWVAELDTGKYSFQACGTTEEEAVEALRRGWARHRKQLVRSYGHNDFYRWENLEDGVCTFLIKPGQCLRDYDTI